MSRAVAERVEQMGREFEMQRFGGGLRALRRLYSD